jgi:hypothetical protein
MTLRSISWAGFATCLLTATMAAQDTAVPAIASPEEVAVFAAGLEACRAGKTATPHPLMKGFVVEHTVAGDQDGACAYQQTMPGKMTMLCALSPTGRRALAEDLRTASSGGPMRGSTRAAQPEWFKECEIQTPNGNRIPAASPPRTN